MIKKWLMIMLLAGGTIFGERISVTYNFKDPGIKSKNSSLTRCKILLPLNRQSKEVTVTYENPVEINGISTVNPSKQGNKIVTSSINSHVTQFLNGIPICLVTINPVQYNTVTKSNSFYRQATVVVETEPVNPDRQVASYVFTPFIRSKLQFTVDNPDAIGRLPLTPRDEDDYEYLIITFPEVKDVWDTIVAFNKRRGMRTKVVMIEDVLQTSGNDNPEKIRNYIKTEYTDHKVVFVVLGGDVEKIPFRELYSESYDHNYGDPDRFLQIQTGSDMYFATFDGNWNNNNNDKFGEPGEEDMFWEVYVSRLPVDSVEQLENIIKKTLHYSETPKKHQVLNTLLAAKFLTDEYGKTIWGLDNLEYTIDYKEDYNWKTWGWPSNTFDISMIADKIPNPIGGWEGTHLKERIFKERPAWVTHEGHGSENL